MRLFIIRFFILLGLIFPALASAANPSGTIVRLQTSLGPIDIALFDTAAPLSVANFLNYVNSGAYNNSFIHRSMPGFIIQGGGYTWNSTLNQYNTIVANAPVMNEFSPTRSNVRGTVAMAKLAGDPNSATTEWFINLADNSANLDTQNGGFTVFGQVIGNGMQVADAIAALNWVNAGGAFANLPLITLPASGTPIQQSNLVMVNSVTALSAAASINLSVGWNLLGNSVSAPLTVASTFGDSTKISTVWKWIPSSSKWAFYSPTQIDGGQAYAATKGYDFLTTINGGEGFWVNALAAFPVQPPSGTVIISSTFSDQTAPQNNNLPSGWSLIAIGDQLMPNEFLKAISTTTPTPGVVPTSITTLWAWNSALKNWYFYAPNLDNLGTLSSYITSKSYLGFGTKTLDPTMGFWVNHP